MSINEWLTNVTIVSHYSRAWYNTATSHHTKPNDTKRHHTIHMASNLKPPRLSTSPEEHQTSTSQHIHHMNSFIGTGHVYEKKKKKKKKTKKKVMMKKKMKKKKKKTPPKNPVLQPKKPPTCCSLMGIDLTSTAYKPNGYTSGRSCVRINHTTSLCVFQSTCLIPPLSAF